jgi:hypothetical protein
VVFQCGVILMKTMACMCIASFKVVAARTSALILPSAHVPLGPLHLYQATPKVIRKLARNISASAVDFQPVLMRFGGNLPPRTQPAQGAV